MEEEDLGERGIGIGIGMGIGKLGVGRRGSIGIGMQGKG